MHFGLIETERTQHKSEFRKITRRARRIAKSAYVVNVNQNGTLGARKLAKRARPAPCTGNESTTDTTNSHLSSFRQKIPTLAEIFENSSNPSISYLAQHELALACQHRVQLVLPPITCSILPGIMWPISGQEQGLRLPPAPSVLLSAFLSGAAWASRSDSS